MLAGDVVVLVSALTERLYSLTEKVGKADVYPAEATRGDCVEGRLVMAGRGQLDSRNTFPVGAISTLTSFEYF